MAGAGSLLRAAAAAAVLHLVQSLVIPPFNSVVSLTSVINSSMAFRHCNYVGSLCPVENLNDDFQFTVVPALNGAAPPAVSFRSTNFPTYYISPISGGGVGIVENPNTADAAWNLARSLDGSGNYSLQSLSGNPAYNGLYLTYGSTNNAPCHYTAPSGDAVLSSGTVNPSLSSFRVAPPPPLPPAVINITATNVTHKMNPLFLGCHIDPGYTQEPRGWYSQLVYGESFEKGTTAVYAWNDITQSSTARANCTLDPATTFNPNMPAPTLHVAYTMGSGVAGWSNRGIGNEGMSLQGGKPYEGYLFVLAPTGGQLWVAANDFVQGRILDSAVIDLPASNDWQQVPIALTPVADTVCTGIAPGSDPTVDCGKMGPNPGHICIKCSGELQVGLAAPGDVHIGYVYFSPGPWGRLGEQPVLLSAVQAMQEMGTRIIRQGGTVSRSFIWKDWRGVPWQRGSMQHVWGDSLVSGWGPFEFIDMANALDIVPVLTFAYDTNSQDDWADLLEYAWGDESTVWGAVRIHNDSHPAPYNISIFELGNEQENPDFAAQVAAMEARRASINGPPIRYMYPTNQGVSNGTATALLAAGVNPAVIMPDCHVGGGGGINCATQDFAALPGFKQSFINCETNAGISTHQRAMQEATDLQSWFNYGAGLGEDATRLIGRTASFCSERSGHYDAFDQGISFFLPNMTWLQPPGFVHSMISKAWQPNAVFVSSNVTNGYPASAQVSDDGSAITVQVVNYNAAPGSVLLVLNGFNPVGAVTVWTLANGDLSAGNTPAAPAAISPVESSTTWTPGGLQLQLAPYSFTVVQAWSR